ncbi:hypothetical protein D3C81_850540 [compost metagenome]
MYFGLDRHWPLVGVHRFRPICLPPGRHHSQVLTRMVRLSGEPFTVAADAHRSKSERVGQSGVPVSGGGAAQPVLATGRSFCGERALRP